MEQVLNEFIAYLNSFFDGFLLMLRGSTQFDSSFWMIFKSQSQLIVWLGTTGLILGIFVVVWLYYLEYSSRKNTIRF